MCNNSNLRQKEQYTRLIVLLMVMMIVGDDDVVLCVTDVYVTPLFNFVSRESE